MARNLFENENLKYKVLEYLETALSPSDFHVLVETKNDIESILNKRKFDLGYELEELILYVKYLRENGI